MDERSLPVIIADVNRTLCGWFERHKHCYKTTFPDIDSLVRGCLRSIQRKRTGRARGRDHQKRPNAFLAKHRLLNPRAAHRLACQSSLR